MLPDVQALILASPIIQPEGRRAATAATFGQQAALCVAHCETYGVVQPTLIDLRAAFARLAQPREGDEGAVVSRRRTLGESASTLSSADPKGGDDTLLSGSPDAALPWFTATVAAFLNSEDPRQIAMRETAAREAAELGDDFPRFLLALRALPEASYATGAIPVLRSGDCGCNATRYPQDNHPPDALVEQLWANGVSGSFVFRRQHAVCEVAPLVELAGGAWNDSTYAIRSWIQTDDGSWSRSDEPWPAARRPRAAALGALGVQRR